MSRIVFDSSVIIDLERAALLETTFQLSHQFGVPDILYERELRPRNGAQLLALGLRVFPLSEAGVAQVALYRRRRPGLSICDAFALAVAKEYDMLLTGDKSLRQMAAEEHVEYHGTLWIFDQIETAKILTVADLESRLSTLAAHEQCHLPKNEIAERVVRYKLRRIAGS